MARDNRAPPRAGTRIVHVVRQFSPSVGGLEDAVMSLASYQRVHQGLDSSVVTLNRAFTDRARVLPTHDQIRGVPVRRLPWRGSRRYPLAPTVLGHVRGADLIHVHGIDFFFDFLAATRPIHRRPMIASTHGGFFHTQYASRLKQRWFDTVTRRSVRAYGALIACSDADERMFRPLAPPHLTVIENGIDTGKFGRHASARDEKRLLSFGRFATHKRIAVAFDLLRILRERDPAWNLTVAGAAWDQTEQDLRAEAARRGAADAVRFLLSPSDDALGAEMAHAGFFVSASAHEGFGIAAVEAAAGGLFPVLSDIAPFVRLTEKLGEGVVFSPESPATAAHWIHELAADPVRAAARRDAMQRRAQAYDWSGAAAEHGALYASVLGQS